MAEPALLHSQLLEQHGFNSVFTLRQGGVSGPPFDSFNFGSGLGDPDSNIEKNLDLLVKSVQLSHRPHLARQVHGTDFCIVEGAGYQHETEADIIIANRPGTAVAVRTADCLPLLLADAASGIAAAVHAGWRGTAAGVVRHAVNQMQQLGANPEHIVASLGPCIGPCCFVVGHECADALKLSARQAKQFIHTTEGSEIRVDLAAINRLQLLEGGLIGTNIECISACTACNPAGHFSFRRDGKLTGRHLAVVATPSST